MNNKNYLYFGMQVITRRDYNTVKEQVLKRIKLMYKLC